MHIRSYVSISLHKPLSIAIWSQVRILKKMESPLVFPSGSAIRSLKKGSKLRTSQDMNYCVNP